MLHILRPSHEKTLATIKPQFSEQSRWQTDQQTNTPGWSHILFGRGNKSWKTPRQ